MKTKSLSIILLLVISFVLTGCSKEDPPCLISGTVTPCPSCEGDFAGYPYVILIDHDLEMDNFNHVKSFKSVYPEGVLEYSIDISDVPPGNYYVYMIMSHPQDPQDFYLLGCYGLDPDANWDLPDNRNVEVKCGAVADWEICD